MSTETRMEYSDFSIGNQGKMTTNCKYCNEEEDKQHRPGLICENCMCFVHLTCLQRPGTPGDLVCDVFFDFVCEDCSQDKMEVFTRNKFPWVNVIYLTLNHLSTQSYGISNHGYFHYKTHICSFIDRNWQTLFGSQSKQKKNWVGTIAGVLSVYNKLFFKSGSGTLGETGWWRLLHSFSPAVAAHIIQEVARDKPKVRPRNQPSQEKYLFISKIIEIGYKELINSDTEGEAAAPSPTSAPCPSPSPVPTAAPAPASVLSLYDHLDSDSRTDMMDENYEDSLHAMTSKDGSYSDLEFRGFDFASSHLLPPQSDSSSAASPPRASPHRASPHRASPHRASPHRASPPRASPRRTSPRRTSPSRAAPGDDSDSRGSERDKRPAARPTRHEEKPLRRESLFSTQPNSIDMPWEAKLPEPTKDVVEMTQYEEVQLLKQVENLIPKVKEPSRKAYLCRLKAKLALRRLKRHKHLPIFDFDKTVQLLGGYVTEDPRTVNNAERVLDRFQRSYLMDNLSGTIASTNYGTVLVARGGGAPLRSAHSGAALRPYVRRERLAAPWRPAAPSRPPPPAWLRLTSELLTRTHRHIKDYEPPPLGTLDYSYVRPEHIAAVNNLCAQFFWPGIDLTEALQYPEFSCVVTYKRLVVGCAFLVPEARAAYISFVLVRPAWRRAGLASFMLYHLLQTCSGKDVTLHVSPTNPAIFLYQKFGFKVEELVQDFYEKYYDIDYKGCRHALFLRLVR